MGPSGSGSLHASYVYAGALGPAGELPRFGGNAQLGCGLVVRRIKDHRYVYFWSYEPRSWGSYRAWTYVGPVARPTTRARANALLLAYHQRALREIGRRVATLRMAAGISR